MTFKKFSFLFIFAFILNLSNAYSEQKIAFINLDFVIENTEIGKSVLVELDKINQQNISKLKKKENELKNQENTIKKKQNIISENELNKEISLLKTKIKDFRKEKNKLVENLNQQKNAKFKNLFDKINPIIQEYMAKNSIEILLDRKNVYIGRVGSDITKEIINEINNNLKN